MDNDHAPGSLVSYRQRDWVVLPSDDDAVVLLRPLGGSGPENLAVHRRANERLRSSMFWETIEASSFPDIDPATAQDHGKVKLLLDAARLLLRDGAAPFRCLGHLSVRPRPYQFLPMIMALRLEVARLLIADDVGVGKTIEAGLIARELLDRRQVKRVAVICPPALCDQWQRELEVKFQIPATVVRAATVSALENHKPQHLTIFQHYPHLVCSIDLIKGERYKASFMESCPDLVIIDEAHTVADNTSQAAGQVLRRRLAEDIAARANQHLLLLTATPHSGIDQSFRSLLSLLQPAFADVDLARLANSDRIAIARHFVQRTRGDVKQWLGEGHDTPFPEREPHDATYHFSRSYQDFFERVYRYTQGLVESAEGLSAWGKRLRFWSALSLLRSAASSPAQAESALRSRAAGRDAGDDEISAEALAEDDTAQLSLAETVLDRDELDTPSDEGPEQLQRLDAEADSAARRRLLELARQAAELRGRQDAKLAAAVDALDALLADGRHPIVWCRFVATAEYLGEELARRLSRRHAGLRVVAVTGRAAEDERREKVESLASSTRRILVATDCLSEGVNLQDRFDACLHYDLPWNPNRLEQREGRVDRFGQRAATVPTIMLYGTDNPVDGAVLTVLLRKAQTIHRRLGVHVPVPIDDATVTEALVGSLFHGSDPRQPEQLSLFGAGEGLQDLHVEWDRAAEREQRERQTRTRFAQHAIKPDEVVRELEATDRVLGDPAAARAFLLTAAERLPFTAVAGQDGVIELQPDTLPQAVRYRIGAVPDPWRIAFSSPTPEGATYVGRSHPLLEALAEYVFDLALTAGDGTPPASRCGAVASGAVARTTRLLLLRLRYLLTERRATPTLAEETIVWGYRREAGALVALPDVEALHLLEEPGPIDHLDLADRRDRVQEALADYEDLTAELDGLRTTRAELLAETHRRVRRLEGGTAVTVEACADVDLLGLLVLVPRVGGGR